MSNAASLRRVLGIAVWVCGVGLASCHASAPPADLSSRFFAVHTAMQASGLTQVGAVSRGELGTGQSAKQPLELDASCVTIVAIGGPSVQDLGLRLRDAEGKEVARDDMQAPDASVRYCADQPGKHELELVMAKGQGGYALTMWKGGQPARSLEATASASATVTGGGSCEAPTVIVNGQTYVGDTAEGRSMEEGSCGNTAARELVYRLDLPTRQRVTLDVRAQFDAVLYVRRGECADPDSEAACNDDAPGGGRRSKIDEVFAPGTYYVFVDGYGEEEGAFRMTVRMRPTGSARAECEAAPLLASTGSARGSLSERVSTTRASCGRNAVGPDMAYRLDVTSRTRVRVVHTASGYQPVVHVRRDCADPASEVGCAEGGMQSNEAAFVGLLDPGTYWVYADAAAEAAAGTYVLTARTASDLGGTASGDTCGAAISLADTVGEAEGDTFAARDDVRTSCGSAHGGDVAFRIDVHRRARLFSRLKGEEGKHRLALQRTCGVAQTELACGEAVDAELAPGAYWLVVDDAEAESFGRFRLGYRIQDLAQVDAACASAPPLNVGRLVTGSTVAAGNRFSASCAGAIDEQAGPDRVYSLRIDKPSAVQLKVNSSAFPAVLSMRSACANAATELGCRVGSSPGEVELERRLNPGTYYVLVDGRQAGMEGDFSLQVSVEPVK